MYVVRTGWAYPWAVRIRLCDLMLRGMFDTLDEASYVESKDALLQLLQNRVWPLLGISKHIHSTIYAWIHFRQFAVTGASCCTLADGLSQRRGGVCSPQLPIDIG